MKPYIICYVDRKSTKIVRCKFYFYFLDHCLFSLIVFFDLRFSESYPSSSCVKFQNFTWGILRLWGMGWYLPIDVFNGEIFFFFFFWEKLAIACTTYTDLPCHLWINTIKAKYIRLLILFQIFCLRIVKGNFYGYDPRGTGVLYRRLGSFSCLRLRG